MKDGKVVILVVDDSFPDYKWKWEYQLPDGVEVVSTTELEKGRRIFRERIQEIDIVVIDHQVIGGTTPELVREIKASEFKGVLIGVSFTNLRALQDAGCDYVCDRNNLFPDESIGTIGHLTEEIKRVRRRS